MKMSEYIDSLKLELTGYITQIELPDETIEKVIYKSLKELQRYINEPKLVTVPFAKCIDLKDFKCSYISNIYRTKSYTGTAEDANMDGVSDIDPAYAQKWAIFANGASMYNLSDWLYNYYSYSTLQQISNTASTDLAFKHDRHDNKLYINVNDRPQSITIEYVPIYENVEDIKSDYWQDVLLKLSVAMTKTILGRIRTKYKSTNGLWEIDGATILEEGNNELAALRETLRINSQITYGVD